MTNNPYRNSQQRLTDMVYPLASCLLPLAFPSQSMFTYQIQIIYDG
ncbi:hypothetical protein BJP36_42600 [Moorena producens JHB]|uniref:Uncharacterized protein n=1 Tax=Moorena producens (strain JHB) TaxID=1454205 RepID=A0A9Q9UVP8_MOOP1|nr:hypothetical protein [Moorena producens]WAN69049.1 hypothetical protein BJP36_42600 [Moorena producens JHB]